MKKGQKKSRPRLDIAAMRAEVAARGWSFQDLADKAGLKLSTVYQEITSSKANGVTLARLERTLGMPFFCSASTWTARGDVLDRFGIDPALTPVRTLKLLGRQLGIHDIATVRDREGVVSKIFAFAAANPRTRTTSPPPQTTH